MTRVRVVEPTEPPADRVAEIVAVANAVIDDRDEVIVQDGTRAQRVAAVIEAILAAESLAPGGAGQ